MKQDKFRKGFWTSLVLLNIGICILALFFVQEKDYSANQKEYAHLIGASYMTMNNEFYKIISEEISARVEAEGDKLVLRDPALDAHRQHRQILEMLDMGIDVLIVTPVEWESLTDVLKKAKAQGVLIIVVDTKVYDSGLADCTITSDNYNAGYLVGEYFACQYNQARLLIMTHEMTKSGQDRVQGFLDAVAQKKGIQIVKKIECMGQVEIAMPKIQETIDEGTEFDHIFCLNDLASVGVAAALEENNIAKKVGIYGVDASPDSKALIKEGIMEASAAQFPSEIGKKAADAVYRLLAGNRVDRNILVPVELITQGNVEEFGTDRWQ
ncbi:MAG: sugar ABC transporter substrate-binding protein [Eubacterium sp.]|nr:sugar ABC transporter substrate-binding protein [Eubacterium sp.]